MNPADPIWGGFRGNYTLPDDEVHVWQTTLDMAASGFAKLQQILSPDERERADRFHFEVDRRRAVIGRGWLRLLLGQILNLPLQFNVSHSGDLILIAIAIGRAVGVDVERIRTDLDPDSIAARFFSAGERKILASLAGPARYQAFFTCWTRKEAYLKARGVGLSLPLDQFDVSFLPNEVPRLLATRPDPAEAGRWRLEALDVAAGYAAALVAPASAWKLKCWNWHPMLLTDGTAGIDLIR